MDCVAPSRPPQSMRTRRAARRACCRAARRNVRSPDPRVRPSLCDAWATNCREKRCRCARISLLPPLRRVFKRRRSARINTGWGCGGLTGWIKTGLFTPAGPDGENFGRVRVATPRGSSSSICLLICSFVRRLFILINLFPPPVSRSQEETFCFLPPSKLKPQHIFFIPFLPSFVAHARALTRLSVVVVETAAPSLSLPPPTSSLPPDTECINTIRSRAAVR